MKTQLLILGFAVSTLAIAQVGRAEEPPTENAGYAFNELRSVDLPVGRKLRMCLHRIEPGGATALHDHKGRPAVNYVLKGTMVARRMGMPDQVLHVGDGLAEGKDTPPHWFVNNTNEPVEFVEVDIVRP